MTLTTTRRENITDAALDRFRSHYRNPRITKWDIFHYIYALLHHPAYRERFAENLKRELPRIPFAPAFPAFAQAGQELTRLHVDYEKLEPWPLKWIEDSAKPLSYTVEKMRLSKDKTSLTVNATLTLAGIPPETFQYRLGSRSALEWVIDQYRVAEDPRSDPNRRTPPNTSSALWVRSSACALRPSGSSTPSLQLFRKLRREPAEKFTPSAKTQSRKAVFLACLASWREPPGFSTCGGWLILTTVMWARQAARPASSGTAPICRIIPNAS